MAKWHGNGKPSDLKGKPNKKWSKGELAELGMATAEYEVRRKKEKDGQKYRGSQDEMNHRLFMNFRKK